MPQDVLQSIENRILLLLSRVSFARLGIFAHPRYLYGMNTEIRDIRPANIAALLSTYIHNPRNIQYLHLSLTRIQRTQHARRIGRPAKNLEHPACSWLNARAFSIERVQETPDEERESISRRKSKTTTAAANRGVDADAPRGENEDQKKEERKRRGAQNT